MAKYLSKKAAKTNGPSCKNKRPLSAYNIFALLERNRILYGEESQHLPYSAEEARRVCSEYKCRGKRAHRKSHGRIGFREMGRIIVHRWKNLDDKTRSVLTTQAAIEKQESIARKNVVNKDVVTDVKLGSTANNPTTAVNIETAISDLKQKIQMLESCIIHGSTSCEPLGSTQMFSSSESICDSESPRLIDLREEVSFVCDRVSSHHHCSVMPLDWADEIVAGYRHKNGGLPAQLSEDQATRPVQYISLDESHVNYFMSAEEMEDLF